MALQTLKRQYGTLYRHDDTDIMMEDDAIWVSIRTVDCEGLLLVDKDEWPAFVEMINAIDAKRKEASDGIP